MIGDTLPFFIIFVIATEIEFNPFTLSLSKGRSWFDGLTTNGVRLAHHERYLAQPIFMICWWAVAHEDCEQVAR